MCVKRSLDLRQRARAILIFSDRSKQELRAMSPQAELTRSHRRRWLNLWMAAPSCASVSESPGRSTAPRLRAPPDEIASPTAEIDDSKIGRRLAFAHMRKACPGLEGALGLRKGNMPRRLQ